MEKSDISPIGHTGRLAAAWIDIFGGALVASLYICPGEGWSERNYSIWHGVGPRRRQSSVPWIIAVDGQMSPTEFKNGAGEHPHAGCRQMMLVASQGMGAYKVKNNWSNIDYFLVDPVFDMAFASVEVQPWVSWPHQPVLLTMNLKNEVLHEVGPTEAA